jgi:hypothetical protein
MKRIPGALLVLAFGLVAGCNRCEKLTESLCRDLGPEDCGTWKALGGPEKVLPGGRGVNQACGMMLSNEDGYQGLLLGAQGLVVADQLQNASAAKDAAKVKELSEKPERIVAAVKAGLAKLQNH